MSKKPRTDELVIRRCDSIASCYTSLHECYVAKGQGALLWDVDGREYIDFAGGIAVTCPHSLYHPQS